jgi:hypothetical protein
MSSSGGAHQLLRHEAFALGDRCEAQGALDGADRDLIEPSAMERALNKTGRTQLNRVVRAWVSASRARWRMMDVG